MHLRADQLTLVVDGQRALDGATLDLPQGEQVLVLGGAGSGKTTLLKCLAGLWAPTAGRVLWNGDDPWRLTSDERRAKQAAFGMVFQTDALFDSMSVLENVVFPLTRRRVERTEAIARAKEALDQVGLAHAADALPEQLSGGMRKRAGIARAIVARPEVLLADDPLAALDPDTAAKVAELLLRVASGRTLVVCASDPECAPRLSRTEHLLHGRFVDSARAEVSIGP